MVRGTCYKILVHSIIEKENNKGLMKELKYNGVKHPRKSHPT